jgi:hypothetical protein
LRIADDHQACARDAPLRLAREQQELIAEAHLMRDQPPLAVQILFT